MTTQTEMEFAKLSIVENNKGIRSGGYTWTQYRLNNGAWFLADEAKNKVAESQFLITNSNLAKVLGMSRKTLSEYAQGLNREKCYYHSDCPSYFHYSVTSKRPAIRNKQLMWTLSGLYYLLFNKNLRIHKERKSQVMSWYSQMSARYGDSTQAVEVKEDSIAQPVAPVVSVASPKVEATTETKETMKISALKYVSDIIDQLWEERNARRALEAEVADLKARLQFITVPTSVSKQHANVTLDSIKAAMTSRIKFDQTESLSRFVSRLGTFRHGEDLTKMGLLNSDQVYGLFSDFWVDPVTNLLIAKEKFQAILRSVFHLTHSDHRTPLLKAKAIRHNYAVVCQVQCKKLPNPRGPKGEILEKDNPAYLASKEPCVRFQTRYTSKAVEYLRTNWSRLLNEPASK